MPSYNNLWKILIDRNLKRTDLIFYAGVSSNVVSNMGKNLPVSDVALEKIASFLECDVCQIVSDDQNRYSGISKCKENGVVYTPAELANYVASRIVSHTITNNSIRILDPAIGGGELIVSLIKQIRLLSSAPIECIGFELDSEVVESTKNRIENASQNISCTIFTEDFIDTYLTKELGLFDYIIANPPYVRTQILGSEKSRKLAKMLNLTGRVDIYYAFMLISSKLLSQDGVAGFITSNKFLSIKAGQSLRTNLLHNTSILEICDFGDTKLFDASVLPCVTIFKNGITNPNDVEFTSIYEVHVPAEDIHINGLFTNIDSSCITNYNGKTYQISKGKLEVDNKTGVWSIKTMQSNAWLSTIESNTFCVLSDIAKIRVGIKSTADSIFIMSKWESPGPIPELARPLITHRNAGQIKSDNDQFWLVIYPHYDENGKTKAVNLDDYPISKAYLEKNKQKLSSRKYVEEAGRNWYEVWVPQKAHLWSKPKIVFRDIADVPQFWFDNSGAIVNGDCYWIDFTNYSEDMIYLCLAVFNSPLIEKFYDLKFNTKLYSGKRRYMTQYVDQFPIPDPNKSESKILIDLVKRYLMSNNTDCSLLKEKIDEMVYEAFGLSQKSLEVTESEFLNSEPYLQTAEYDL